MARFSWGNWLRSFFRSQKKQRRKPFQRLRLEGLESRLVPTNFTWSGGGGANTNWSYGPNWVGGTAPTGSTIALADLLFPSSATSTVATNNLPLLGGVLPTFNSITISGSNYTLNGNPLALGTTSVSGSGFLTLQTGSVNDVISLNMQLGGAGGTKQFFTTAAFSSLTISGQLSGTTGSTLTKEGSGTLILTKNNSAFTGPVTIDNNAGFVEIANSKALGSGAHVTSVGANSTLDVASGTGTVSQSLILNGPGNGNVGALLNIAGNNTWSGGIEIDSDVYFGATTGILDITGVITDLGAGHNVTKVGQGTVSFDAANTYRGTTTIVDGILRIENAKALGSADGTASTGTKVLVNPLQIGALQLYDPSGVGFTVVNELLNITDAGPGGIGSLDNLFGNNTWAGNIILTGGPTVDVEGASQLTVTGVVSGGSLTKIGTGELIFTNANTYGGGTTILGGVIDIRDSLGLGAAGKTTVVTDGTALWIEVDNTPDSITGTVNTLKVPEVLDLTGTGINGTGALLSISGINIWNGAITLEEPEVAIGVNADPNESNSANYFASDYSLTTAKAISGDSLTTLEKVGAGELILPIANPYSGPTDIHQGWITIQNNQSLGTQTPNESQTVEPYTTVEAGAALHLNPASGTNLNIANNLYLTGTGIAHPYAALNHEGALLSLTGNNVMSGLIELSGNAGIGVTSLTSPGTGNTQENPNVDPNSSLTLTGQISDFSSGLIGGFTKLGTQHMDIQGPGAYSGNVVIAEGVLEDQNSTGLGLPNAGTVTVDTGTALELDTTIATQSGGISTGLEIWNRRLILNGSGNIYFNDQSLNNVTGDNMWRGPTTLATSATVDVEPNTRLILFGTIDDGLNPAPGGSSMTKIDTGELMLAGTNTYRGNTYISAGIVTLESNQALGAGGTTIVAPGSQLQLEAGITISGETVIVQGTGVGTTPTTTLTWFPVGPAAGNNDPFVATNQTVSGRVTAVVTDPTDPNVIYIGTAGGGAWKTINAGRTWEPLFDAVGAMYVGAMAIDPNDSAVLYLGTGVAENSPDSYAGTGLYRSTDFGTTWTLLTNVGGGNPLGGTAITAIVADPNVGVDNVSGLPADPDNSVANPILYITNSDQTVNGTQTTGDVGVWRYDPVVAGHPKFFDLTNVISANRATATAPTTTTDAVPNTPGPDDDYRIDFPQKNATWSALSLSFTQDQGWMLYAALGTPSGEPVTPIGLTAYPTPIAEGNVVNAVYHLSINQEFYSSAPVYYDTPALGGGYSATYGYGNPVWFISTNNIDNNPANATTYGTVLGIDTDGTEFPNPLSGPVILKDPNIYPNAGQFVPNGYISLTSQWTQTAPTTFVTTLYAAVSYPTFFSPPDFTSTVSPPGLMSLYRSITGGQSWTGVTTLPVDPLAPVGEYANTVVVSPFNVNIVAISGQQTLESTDGGKTWINFSKDVTGNGPEIGTHTLSFDAAGDLMIGTDGGIWRLNATNDLWNNLNGNLDTMMVNSLSANPANLNSAFIAAQGSGVAAFSGNEAWTVLGGYDGGQVAVNPNNPQIIYAEADGTLYESTNGGLNFTALAVPYPNGTSYAFNIANALYFPALSATFPTPTLYNDTGILNSLGIDVLSYPSFSFPLVVDPVNTSRLLIGGLNPLPNGRPTIVLPAETLPALASTTPQLLQESVDGGQTWTSISTSATIANLLALTGVFPAEYQGAFLTDPRFTGLADLGANTYDPNTIYIIGVNAPAIHASAAESTAVYVTKNHGNTWVKLSPPGSTATNGQIQTLYVDPTDENHIYVVYNGGSSGSRVYQSTDGGQSWSNVSFNLTSLSLFSITGDPRSGALYAGTSNGVWELASGAITWQRIGVGMPEVQVNTLTLNQNLNTLTAGTYGRGVFTMYLDDALANSGALRAVSGSAVWSGPVQLSSATTIAAEGTQALQNGVSTASLTILGPISDLVAGANNPLTKIGGGTVVLGGNNTYGGVTIVAAGALVVDSLTALGATNNGTIVDPGAALELESSLNSEPIQLNGDGFAFNGHFTGALRNISNNNTYTGVITLESNSTIGVDSGSMLTIASPGGIGDGGANYNLVKELTGTLVLASADSYGGTTLVNQGILNIQNGAALGTSGALTTVLDGAQLQVQGNITVANENLRISGTGIFGTGALENVSGQNYWLGTVTLAKDPSFSPASVPPSLVALGSLALNSGDSLTIEGAISGASAAMGVIKVGPGVIILDDNNSYSGNTLIVAGYLRIQTNTALGAAGTTTTVDSGAALQLDGDPTNIGASLNVVNEALFLNGSGPANGGALDNYSGDNTWGSSITLQSNTAIGAEANTALTVTGKVQDPSPLSATAASLTKVGPGVLEFPTANTYGGTTYVNNGDLRIGDPKSLGASSPEVQLVTVNYTGTAGQFQLTFNGQTTDPVNFPLPYNATASQVAAALNALSSINAVGGSVTVTQLANVYTVTFGGTLVGQDLPQMTATGTNGVSIFVSTLANGAGGTVVNSGGTLQLEGGIQVQDENLTLNGNGFNNAGALDSFNGTNTWTANGTFVQEIVLGSNASMGAESGQVLTVIATITDNGGNYGLTKFGPGVLVFQGGNSNAYTGLTDVNNGTLILDQAGGDIAVQGNLQVGDGNASSPTSALAILGASNEINSSSSVTVNGNGSFNLNGLVQTISGLNITGGKSGTPSVNLPPASVLTLDGALTGQQDSTGAPATVAGAGTLSLGGNTRTFTINGPGAGAPTADVIISAPISGTASEGVIKAGNGTLQLTGFNTYTGPTTVTQGILLADGPSTLTPTIGNVQLAGGTLGGTGLVGTVVNGSGGGGGTVAPGDSQTSVGTLHTGAESWNSTDTFYVVLQDAGTYSTLSVNGTLNINGASLSGFVGNNVHFGDTFTIISASAINGTFKSNASPGFIIVDGANFQIVYTGNTVVLTRQQDITTTTLTADHNPSVYGQPITFTATVSPELGTGPISTSDTITLKVNGSAVSTKAIDASGVAKFTFNAVGSPTLPVSATPYAIEADFNGDAIYLTSNATLSQTVNKDNSVSNLSADVTSPVFGQTIHVSVTVSASTPGSGTPTGNVVFTLDSTAQSPVALVNGVATLTLPSLQANHIVGVSYVGDSNFNPSSSNSSYIVSVQKDTPNLVISAVPSPATYSQSVTLTVNAGVQAPGNEVPTGNVTFFDGTTSLGVKTLSGGAASVTVPSFTAGTHVITVQYGGDTFVSSGLKTMNLPVNQAQTTMTLVSSANPAGFNTPVTFTATVKSSSPATATPTGSVTFTINGVAQPPVLVDSTGTATITRTNLPAGAADTIVATYVDPQGNFATISASLSQTVLSPTLVTVASSPTSASFGQSVTLTATVAPLAGYSGTPTGSVTFMANGVSIGTAGLNTSTGKAALTTNLLNAGSDSIVAMYLGDTVFGQSSSAPITDTVAKAKTTITETMPPTTVFGQVRTVSATVVPVAPGYGIPTGTVTFFFSGSPVGTVNLNGAGTALFTFASGGVGTYSVTATYNPPTSGVSNYATSSTAGAQLFTIVTASSTTTVATNSPTVFGQPAQITVTAAPVAPSTIAPSGSVTITLDGHAQAPMALNSSGQAVLNIPTLTIGNHTVSATYSGSPFFGGSSSSTVGITVGKASTSLGLTISGSSLVYGQPLTLTAAATANSPSTATVSGNVTFYVDGSPEPNTPLNGSGVATMTLPALGLGTHTFSAVFNANANFNGSTASATPSATVSQANSATAVASSAPTSGLGQAVTFTATVSPVAPSVGVPDGTVGFYVDGNLVGSGTLNGAGQASVTTNSGLTFGSHTVIAKYSGSANFALSNSNPLTQTVLLSSTTTVVPSGPSVYGQGVTFTATVAVGGGSPAPTGTVTFFVDGVNQGTSPLSGASQATLTLSNLSAGAHSIVATYNGDSNIAPSNSSPLAYSVSKAGTTTGVNSSLASSYIGQTVNFTATVAAAAPGAGVPTGSVTFYVNGVSKASVLLNGAGQAVYSTNALGVGNYNVVAVYNGDTNFNAGSYSYVVQRVLSVPPPAALAAGVVAPLGTSAGTSFTLLAEAFYITGVREAIYNLPATITVLSHPAGGALRGSLTTSFSSGWATFSNLSFTANGLYTLMITTDGVSVTIQVNAGGGRQT
jgi:autotransporter-associated beta strand protein